MILLWKILLSFYDLSITCGQSDLVIE